MNGKSIPLLILQIIIVMVSCNSPMNTGLIQELMEQEPAHFSDILKNKDEYEVQIIYTQIDRDEQNQPRFTKHYFNVDSTRYFYPASTVKMPMAFMALEYLNNQPADMHTTMLTDSAFSGQSRVTYDSSSADKLPSIGNYIRKIFLVSDNDAFNRLYEYVGMERSLKMLRDKGFTGSRIVHRLSIALTEEENRHTNPVYFTHGADTIWSEPAKYYSGPLPSPGPILKGDGFLQGDSIISEPMNFGSKNFIPLEELADMLAAVVFPEQLPVFDLTDED